MISCTEPGDDTALQNNQHRKTVGYGDVPYSDLVSKLGARDVPAVPGPQLDLEEVAPVGDQGVFGLVAEEVVRGSSNEPGPLAFDVQSVKEDFGFR